MRNQHYCPVCNIVVERADLVRAAFSKIDIRGLLVSIVTGLGLVGIYLGVVIIAHILARPSYSQRGALCGKLYGYS